MKISLFLKIQFLILSLFVSLFLYAQSPISAPSYISPQKEKTGFPLAVSGKPATIYASDEDFPGVIRAVKSLQNDLKKVTGNEPLLVEKHDFKEKNIVLIGTLGKNKTIDELVKNGKINVTGIQGKWETFLIQTIDKPFPGVDKALVIAGSDKRGTIFGIYDLSSQIGVSPWYWWADVPIKKQPNLYVKSGAFSAGEPAVKYRGIFINDEAPALSGWTREKFGGFNHKFYEHVFELILRLKGNYLWPAMWGNAFYDDDPMNPKLADEYGVVIGTSHHEPLMRAHDEWRRYGKGKWDYTKNDSTLREFWKESIKRMGSNESLVTVGMRGDGDEPMTRETATELLQRIVADQRKIISDVTSKKPEEVPQVWALYKEVQDYYDKGMRVPDDVTLLLCDDNWGNIRKLPKSDEKPRKGGYGIYYHFDYVGGPRNYKWLNTNQIARIWEQMHLAYEYKANQLWIVNVGDIKPMEFPISFFLDYAWNPEKIKAEDLKKYTERWAAQQFGNTFASAIAGILTKYTQYNSRRKPELLSAQTYSLVNYQEAEMVVNDYNKLASEAEKIYDQLAAEYKDAYYQLVLHPVKACANLNELHITTGKNLLYFRQQRASTNDLADKVKTLFEKDVEISAYYNKALAGGKWSHMMDQTHISYTYWQQPEKDVMPQVKTLNLPIDAQMGIVVEGSAESWTTETRAAIMPYFSNYGETKHYFDIFNTGQTSFDFTAETGVPWLTVSQTKGKIEKEQRIWVTLDTPKAPEGYNEVFIKVTGNGKTIHVRAHIFNKIIKNLKGFVENNGYISIEAEHFSKKVEKDGISWKIIPDLGKTLSGITTFPVTAPAQNPTVGSPHLEYIVNLSNIRNLEVNAYFSPTLNFPNGQGLRYGVSFDDEPIQIINLHTDNSNKTWEKWVADNILIKTSTHTLQQEGEHTLKIWMVDAGLVLQKIVIETDRLSPSYLGPPESYRVIPQVK
jgi:hypothetical protein